METLYRNTETGCCPRFDSKPWNEAEMRWSNKLFLKDKATCFFNIPLNMGKVIAKNMEIIQRENALTPKPLMIAESKSPWSTDIFIAISKEIPNAKMEKISGNFLTKAFEGECKNMGNWVKEMRQFVKSKKKTIKKMYFFYTTCPKCAEFYGKNHVVILAKI